MWIKNGQVLNDSFVFEQSDIEVQNELIAQIGKTSSEADIDATECYVIPGFVDTHMHAANGKMFLDFEDDSADIICEFEAGKGTTTLVPALSAAPTEKMVKAIHHLNKVIENPKDGKAAIRGIHLEGPFFAEKFKGAHLPENIRYPSVEEYKILKEACGENFKILTMAPELPGAEDVIPLAVADGVCVSAGHTDATGQQMKHAFSLGVSQGTHTFNAMRGINHRDPGAAGALLTDENIVCELICDFVHISPDIIKLVYKLKGKDKINLITDSEVGAGMPDGSYEVNGRTLTVKDSVTRTEDGTIAGGSSCLIDCVKNIVSLGVPLQEACQMATKNPAKAAGIYDVCGSITVGKQADILVLDKELNIKHIVLRGQKLF